MFASIRKYKVDAGSIDELLGEVEAGLVPALSKAPGYQGHYVIAGDDGSIVSVTGVEDRSYLRELNHVAEAWANQHLRRFHAKRAEVSEGQVRIMHRAGSEARRPAH